jgi:long-chain acyl-CoA synthetase
VATHRTASAGELSEFWGSEVAEEDVLGHPCLNFTRRRRQLSDLLIDSRRFANRDYLVQGERRVSFAENEVAVHRVASTLHERGIGLGDRVLLFGANSIEWVTAFWAILEVGGTIVLGNAWWSKAELAHALDTVQPKVVLADEARAARLPDDRQRLEFDELAAAAARPSRESGWNARRAPVQEDDPAIVLFTSGTTGLPKGAVLSHRGIIATLQGLLVITRRLPLSDGPLPSESRSLLSIPLFHIGGLQQIVTPMLGGGTLVFTEGRFDAAGITALIEREQIAVWSTVPTMVSRVIDHLESVGHPGLPSVRTVGLGGSPVGMQLRTRVPHWFPNAGRGLSVTYGLSEGGGVLVTGAGRQLLDRPGAVGRPLPTVTIRIAEADEAGCGEIVVRCPSVMLGYFGADPTGPDNPITADRWLHTGDIGRIDDDGYVYVTDRSKDIVIRGGENIATPHVENRLLEHPDVREVAVFGLPHPELGEELAAVVVLSDTATSTEDLARFAGEALAYFEVPSRWWIHDGALPQNATGKIVKRLLREQWPRSAAEADGRATRA